MKNNKQSNGSYAPPTAEIIKLSTEQAILSGSLKDLRYESTNDDFWETI